MLDQTDRLSFWSRLASSVAEHWDLFRERHARHFHYLQLVNFLIRRELKVKYRGTILGYLWSMLNPLLTMTVISLVFSRLMRGIPDYNIFVLSGLLIWNVALGTIISGTNSIVANTHLLRKVKMPIWVFPLVSLGSSLTNFLLSLLPFAVVFAFSDRSLDLQILLVPILIIMFALFLTGISLTLATLNVFFRDISHVLDPVLTLVFYATPIIYDRHSDIIPEKIAKILGYNPFTHYIETIRACLYGSSEPPSLESIAITVGLAIISMLTGYWVYKRKRAEILFNL